MLYTYGIIIVVPPRVREVSVDMEWRYLILRIRLLSGI